MSRPHEQQMRAIAIQRVLAAALWMRNWSWLILHWDIAAPRRAA